MNKLSDGALAGKDELFLTPPACESTSIALLEMLGSEASNQLQRMFRDPRVLEPVERRTLIEQLHKAVALEPHVPELRVLLGMALSVDLQAQDALEELREAARLAPDSFIARLKFGELLMRLRICEQASEETHQAALLAANAAQSEMARRQAATLRTMMREGIERGGYSGLLPRIFHFCRKAVVQKVDPVALAGSKIEPALTGSK
jgi:tetratricopeptide (TPR) repeat protein